MSRLVFCAVALALALPACTPQGDPALGPEGYTDNFDRAELGELWNNTGGAYRIVDGELVVRGARNHPLWLRRTLPRNARVEYDVRTDAPDGDLKCEVYGDGVSAAASESYTATSYVVIFGGWGNSLNVLARMDEHAENRAVGPRRRVEPGHTYHMKIERRGSVITAWADGTELVRMDDPDPLEGRGHDHFAFNNWETEVRFDNLRITPL